MALPILKPKDFTGLYKISQNCFSDLSEFITAYEKRYLVQLLGCDLAELFIADLDVSNIPQTQRFIDIYAAFCKENINGAHVITVVPFGVNNYYFRPVNQCNNFNLISDGIKEMLKGFIYWQFSKEQKQKNTVSGQAVNITEVSREASLDEAQINQKYNKAVATFWAIQIYILDSSSVYPEFNGERKRKINFGGAF